jgi:Gpi18-like mannosyltransferase
MLWYFDFVRWYTDAQYPESYLKIGFFLAIKFVAIVADLSIALVIYLMFRKENQKKSLLLSALYLFSPFSFYISALWGQYDQLSFLFLLLSIWMLIRKDVILAPFLLMISVSMKPTSLIFIPLFLWIYVGLRKSLWEYLLGIVLALGGAFLTVVVFTNDNVLHFINYDLKNKVFFKSGFRVSTNSFNFWHIFIGDNAREHFTPYFGIPAYIWGWLSFVVINIFAFVAAKGNTKKSILTAFAIVGLGSWLHMFPFLNEIASLKRAGGISSLSLKFLDYVSHCLFARQ